MYCNFYRFSEKPFDVTPDPKFLYLSPGHQEMLASLIYGITERRGFISIIGEVGTGKTTLINAVLDRLDERTKVAYIFNTAVNFEEMLNMALLELRLSSAEEALSKVEAIHRLNDFAIEQLAKGHNVVLIVDEAQNLDDTSMENLRLLSNLETRKHKLVQIVLSGQPELDIKLRKPELRQLAQRISMKRYITPLTEKDTYEYIQHRLAVAGHKGRSVFSSVFSSRAQKLIWEYSGGTPRKVNMVCDNAFLLGYALRKKKINAKIVEESIKDLSWSPFSEATEYAVDTQIHPEAARFSAALPLSSEATEPSSLGHSHLRFAFLAGGIIVGVSLLIASGFFFGKSWPSMEWRRLFRDHNPISVVTKRETDPIARFGPSVRAEEYYQSETENQNMSKDLDKRRVESEDLDERMGKEEFPVNPEEAPNVRDDTLRKQSDANDRPMLSIPAEAENQAVTAQEGVLTNLVEDRVESMELEEGTKKEDSEVKPEAMADEGAEVLTMHLGTADQSVASVLSETDYQVEIVEKSSSTNVVEERVESTEVSTETKEEDSTVNPEAVEDEGAEGFTRQGQFVIVNRGDFLYKIIKKSYGSYRDHLLYALLKENPDIKNPDFIVPGQVIKLPRSDK